jgi:hypothetical protein
MLSVGIFRQNAINVSTKDKLEGSFLNAKGKVKVIEGRISIKSTKLCRRRYLIERYTEPDNHREVRFPDQRDCMATVGWYGYA